MKFIAHWMNASLSGDAFPPRAASSCTKRTGALTSTRLNPVWAFRAGKFMRSPVHRLHRLERGGCDPSSVYDDSSSA